MTRRVAFDEAVEQIRVDLDDETERVVDADPIRSPTYAKPTSAHTAWRGRALMWVSLALLVLVSGALWVLLELQAGFLGWLMGLVVIAPVAVAALLVGTDIARHPRRWFADGDRW